MKAVMALTGVLRGNKGDTIKFSDDAPGVLQPAPGVRSARWEPVQGRLTIESDGVRIVEVLGELRRVDSWDIDKETGDIEAKASVSFVCEDNLHAEEIMGLFKAEALSLKFRPAQGSLPFDRGMVETLSHLDLDTKTAGVA